MTSRAGEAIHFSRKAVGEGAELILAVGGDGTLNEVINGMVGSCAKLGVIPTGVSNVLALELGIPTGLEEALAVIEAGHTRRIDLGVANGRFFSLMAGVGLDAQSVKSVNPSIKKHFKRYAYHLAGLQSIISGVLPPFQISLNGGNEQSAYAAVISNARFYGGPHQINPHARVDDGLLRCCLFKKGSRIDYLRYFWGVIKKSHHTYPDVELNKINHAFIPTPGIPVQIDGDFFCYTPLKIEIRHRLLTVLAPLII